MCLLCLPVFLFLAFLWSRNLPEKLPKGILMFWSSPYWSTATQKRWTPGLVSRTLAQRAFTISLKFSFYQNCCLHLQCISTKLKDSQNCSPYSKTDPYTGSVSYITYSKTANTSWIAPHCYYRINLQVWYMVIKAYYCCLASSSPMRPSPSLQRKSMIIVLWAWPSIMLP